MHTLSHAFKDGVSNKPTPKPKTKKHEPEAEDQTPIDRLRVPDIYLKKVLEYVLQCEQFIEGNEEFSIAVSRFQDVRRNIADMLHWLVQEAENKAPTFQTVNRKTYLISQTVVKGIIYTL